MQILSPSEIGELLQPYVVGAVLPAHWEKLLEQLTVYLDVLQRWNERTNLTAVREPREMVRRHFGESLFLARHLGARGTLLDLGSGAGFPGLPAQLWWPELEVTLAESQGKKAAFLREVVRVLGVNVQVWAGRAELLAPRCFHQVVLRAVDRPGSALRVAAERTQGSVWVLGGDAAAASAEEMRVLQRFEVPGRERSFLYELGW